MKNRLKKELKNIDSVRKVQDLLDSAINTFRAWGDNESLLDTFSSGLAAQVIHVFEENNIESQAIIIFAVNKLSTKYSYYDYGMGENHNAEDAVINKLLYQIGSALNDTDTNHSTYTAMFKVLNALTVCATFPDSKARESCFNLLSHLEKQGIQSGDEHLVVAEKVKMHHIMHKANVTKQEAMEIKEQVIMELFNEGKETLVMERGINEEVLPPRRRDRGRQSYRHHGCSRERRPSHGHRQSHEQSRSYEARRSYEDRRSYEARRSHEYRQHGRSYNNQMRSRSRSRNQVNRR